MDSKTVQDYEQILQPKFLQTLQGIQGLSWSSFILDVKDGQYVLEVTAGNPESELWDQASIPLKKAFEDVTAKKLQVALSKASSIEEMRKVVPREAQPYNADSRNPFFLYSLGRSIGVEQLDYPGTLGGFITVTTDGSPRVYGLTNNHVINVGKTTNTQRESTLPPFLPSSCLSWLAFLHIYFGFWQHQSSDPGAAGDPTTIETGNTIYCPNYHDLEATKIHQHDPKLVNYKIGQLYAASGRTLPTPVVNALPCILDWALVDLNGPTRSQLFPNIAKLKYNFEPPRTNRQVLRPGYRANTPFPPGPVTYDPNIHLVPGMDVYKWGRTTGITSSQVMFTRRIINMAEVEQWKGTVHNPGGVTGVAELAVRPRNNEPFCQPGDSGSFVIDEEGHLVGLLWGLADDQDTIVTDIRVVFESIREKLGLGPNAVFGVALRP
ncbi:hypothetical protein CSUB01_11641 [Colletotrichum sublineola]|uniref:Uncharacterized protein n=1 Tax=Colletotrichum sublineola TaxID=1173701 RepID=A0A066XH00_COLSU|nr:hypothetical protein CSUB01_11641 [Colletotrichum sublineola]